ncbi:hypothetical protein PQR63_05300 [Herbaspirillum rhizosphaerae]|uniref:Uncharacterized protein n=1 Tax=Herbaspirillum rhizosphaerae TaxID=346179 RepID=A0ABW8Z424_9BURK
MYPMVWRRRSSLVNKLFFPETLPAFSPAPTPVKTPSWLMPASPRQASLQMSLPKQRERMMHITVEREDVTHLRQVVMQSCGHCVCFMRMSPLDHARRMQLCLCIQAEAIPMVMDAVMWALPQAEFSLRQAKTKV